VPSFASSLHALRPFDCSLIQCDNSAFVERLSDSLTSKGDWPVNEQAMCCCWRVDLSESCTNTLELGFANVAASRDPRESPLGCCQSLFYAVTLAKFNRILQIIYF
jgi:hypothetical protein